MSVAYNEQRVIAFVGAIKCTFTCVGSSREMHYWAREANKYQKMFFFNLA